MFLLRVWGGSQKKSIGLAFLGKFLQIDIGSEVRFLHFFWVYCSS